MGIEKLTSTQKETLEEINRLLFSKKTLNYQELLRLIQNAGYKTDMNGGGHMQIHRKSDGTLIRYESGLPVIISTNRNDLPPGRYKEILKIVRDEIEEF